MQQPAFLTPDTRSTDEINTQARECIMQGRFDEAEQLLQTSMQKGKTATACRLMGNILYSRRDLQAALALFDEALKLDEHDHASMAMMAEVYFAMNDVNCAGYSMMAMTEAPAEIRYKERFVHFSANMAFTKYSSLVENAVIDCLKTPGLDCSNLQSLWYNTFSLSPDYRAIYKTYPSPDPVGRQKASGFKRLLGAYTGKGQPDYVFFDHESFRQVKNLDVLLNPFFVLGLRALLVHSLPFEEFFVALRARLLDMPHTPDLLPLAESVAAYAFRTRYIFAVTDGEKNKVEELRPKLEAGLPEGKEWQACIYAAYAPLYGLRNAGMIAEAFAGAPDMSDLIRGQIFEYLTIEEIADTLPELTSIDKGVSAKVQEQYEEFPYPQWIARPRNVSDEGAGAPLKKKGAKILIAGCGTGSEAAQAAVAFPESKILAVDLSRASLAYGALKAKEFNLSNIDFAQADILNLGGINRTFDGILSGGVLHHMEDPVKGWRVLTGLLNPGGLMRVALYSEAARASIAKVQGIIKKAGYPATTEGMKAFRQESAKLLPWEIFHDIARAEDYYQLAMYRDMLFHVQEHRFDLLKIKEILSGQGLTFLKMNVPPAVMAQFRSLYPADPEAKGLENWHDFERRYPDTFIRMYQFWCRKD